jgi:hypothetical protein
LRTGVSGATISGLANRGLVIMALGKVRGGGRVIDVAKVHITEVGREALVVEG